MSDGTPRPQVLPTGPASELSVGTRPALLSSQAVRGQVSVDALRPARWYHVSGVYTQAFQTVKL